MKYFAPTKKQRRRLGRLIRRGKMIRITSRSKWKDYALGFQMSMEKFTAAMRKTTAAINAFGKAVEESHAFKEGDTE